MGPPSKPAEKPKEDDMDAMDVLRGTGVDLREEEQYTFQMYNTSFNSQLSGSQSGTISSGNSFTQFPPADERSFFGAGPANAVGEKTTIQSQDEYHKKAADKAWHDAARNLALSRQRELDNPFLQVGLVHTRVQKIARDNGLLLNTDQKGMMGTMKLPENFHLRDVRVQTAVAPGVALTVTNGNFLPADSMLVDQLALLSIATKHRLRGLVEDAAKLARGRRTGSHGIIPEEWADAAAPCNPDTSSIVTEGAPRSGWESAVSPHSNPLKRLFLQRMSFLSANISKARSLLRTKSPLPFLTVARPLSITARSRTMLLLLYAPRPRRREILKRHACVSGRIELLVKEHRPGKPQLYLARRARLPPNR
jgi:hypothetical protein